MSSPHPTARGRGKCPLPVGGTFPDDRLHSQQRPHQYRAYPRPNDTLYVSSGGRAVNITVNSGSHLSVSPVRGILAGSRWSSRTE
jgi:autotransporter passenger strand-loop-strand repeat protein